MRQASTGMGKLGTNKIIHLNIFLTVLRKNLKVEETDFLKISKGKEKLKIIKNYSTIGKF